MGGQRDTGPVGSFRAVAAIDDAGELVGLLLRYRPPDGRDGWLACEVEALREGLAAAPTAPMVGFVPDDVAVPDVLDLVVVASVALADASVVAALAPVTDAVKVVEGRRIVHGVDRSNLHRVHGPAFARREVVERMVRDVRAGTIRPLAAAATSGLRIGRLGTGEVAS